MNDMAIEVAPLSTPDQRASWDAFSSQSELGHLYQCLWWAEPLAEYGVTTQVLGCLRGKEVVGGALLRSIPIPFTRSTVTECLNGPIFRDWLPAWSIPFVSGVRRLAKAQRSSVVMLRACPNENIHHDLLEEFRRCGLRVKSAPGKTRAIVALGNHTADNIITAFDHGTRRNVRIAPRMNVTVRKVTDESELRQAHATWLASARRKEFTGVRPWASIEPVLRQALVRDLGAVYAAFVESRLVASIFVTYIGTCAEYLYGGFLDEYKRFRPNHVLHYKAIQDCYKLGIDTYDFGNLEKPDDAHNHGVDRFKLSFGAKLARQLDSIVWERRPVLYHGTKMLKGSPAGRHLVAFARRHVLRRGKKPSAQTTVRTGSEHDG